METEEEREFARGVQRGFHLIWVLKDEQAFLGWRKNGRAFQVKNKICRSTKYVKVSELGEFSVAVKRDGEGTALRRSDRLATWAPFNSNAHLAKSGQ